MEQTKLLEYTKYGIAAVVTISLVFGQMQLRRDVVKLGQEIKQLEQHQKRFR